MIAHNDKIDLVIDAAKLELINQVSNGEIHLLQCSRDLVVTREREKRRKRKREKERKSSVDPFTARQWLTRWQEGVAYRLSMGAIVMADRIDKIDITAKKRGSMGFVIIDPAKELIKTLDLGPTAIELDSVSGLLEWTIANRCFRACPKHDSRFETILLHCVPNLQQIQTHMGRP